MDRNPRLALTVPTLPASVSSFPESFRPLFPARARLCPARLSHEPSSVEQRALSKSRQLRKNTKQKRARHIPGETATSTSSSSPYSVAPSVPVVFTLPFGVGAATLSSPLSSVSALLSLSACTWLGGRTPTPTPRPRRLPRRPLMGGGGGEGEKEVDDAVSRTRRLEMMESSASSYGRANSLRK